MGRHQPATGRIARPPARPIPQARAAEQHPLFFDGGTWRVEEGNLLLCERNPGFLVAIAMGTERVKLPAGVVLFSAFPLAEDGWLQPDNAVWIQRD